MGKDWEYAKLTKRAKEIGGPKKLLKASKKIKILWFIVIMLFLFLMNAYFDIFGYIYRLIKLIF